ncbi:MAG TPA: hypothetical protein VEY51_04665 [Chondromyces sp.]|nr:hypothetical protein [Chondromyces sp.]
MDRKKLAMTTLVAGAAFLMRNEESRGKVMNQLKSLGSKKK